MFIMKYIAKKDPKGCENYHVFHGSHERISCRAEVERLTLFSKRELVSFYKAENIGPSVTIRP